MARTFGEVIVDVYELGSRIAAEYGEGDDGRTLSVQGSERMLSDQGFPAGDAYDWLATVSRDASDLVLDLGQSEPGMTEGMLRSVFLTIATQAMIVGKEWEAERRRAVA